MNGNRETILIVDDVPEDILVLDEILKKEFQVKAVTNGEAALKIAQGENPPDLILLDIMMPGMDGYETLRQLSQHQKSAEIPVIFLTAKTGLSTKNWVLTWVRKTIYPSLQARLSYSRGYIPIFGSRSLGI
ncbi:response regulator [uncultured Sphaerochaeta sp.]|uniref:response regulator n=1 Tax=uncultured Sphaerochaeta sp. TaxID=886478 RepID=UPI002A0A414E|nr:response regulator [uncultured Sphaerochaeta sp.]